MILKIPEIYPMPNSGPFPFYPMAQGIGKFCSYFGIWLVDLDFEGREECPSCGHKDHVSNFCTDPRNSQVLSSVISKLTLILYPR